MYNVMTSALTAGSSSLALSTAFLLLARDFIFTFKLSHHFTTQDNEKGTVQCSAYPHKLLEQGG